MPDAPLSPLKVKPIRERGYAADSFLDWLTDPTNETTPELVWPLSVPVFEQMRRKDPQVVSVLRAVTSPIVRTQWRVDGTGCRDEVTEFVADNLGLPIVDAEEPDDSKAKLRGKSRFSWDEHLRLALLCLSFGHSYFEQVYYPPDAEGRYRLRKLGPRLPQSISKVNVARDGGLISIEQYGYAGGSAPIKLPVNRLVAYVLEREGSNWLGISMLRAAYGSWLLKARALRTWSTSVDRNGIGIPIYTASERETSLTAGQELASSARSGDNAGGAIPYGSKFELVGVTGTLPDIDKFVRYHDEAIARSALVHVLNLGSQGGGQVGSYNLGSVFRDTFDLALDSIAGLIADTASAHIVEDLVDLNFGPTEPAPQIVYDDIGTRMSELDRVREMAGLSSDADLVKFLRTGPAGRDAGFQQAIAETAQRIQDATNQDREVPA